MLTPEQRAEALRLAAAVDHAAHVSDFNSTFLHVLHQAAALLRTLAAAPPAEPVGVAEPMPGSAGGFTIVVFDSRNVPIGTPLYAAPQAREPLTEKEVRAICAKISGEWSLHGRVPLDFARAVERAHGIGAKG